MPPAEASRAPAPAPIFPTRETLPFYGLFGRQRPAVLLHFSSNDCFRINKEEDGKADNGYVKKEKNNNK